MENYKPFSTLCILRKKCSANQSLSLQARLIFKAAKNGLIAFNMENHFVLTTRDKAV